MPESENIVRVFKTLDSATLWELAAIGLLASLFVVLVQRLLPWLANRLPGRKRLYLLALAPFIRLLIILVALSMALPLIIEPTLQNMILVLSSVGLALGFALKDYASSLLAGIVAIGEQNYRAGDWVRLGEHYGEVRHIGMRSVELVTPDDDRVLVPHSLLWSQPVVNANNGNARLQCCSDFYLHPGHDAALARQALEDVALTSAYLALNEPIAVIISEQPWGTHYRLKAYPVDSAQQFRFSTDLCIRGKAALRALGLRFCNLTATSLRPE
ncbi:MAG: mechanosensitive ion channel family protein [Gammaproteobacteria bacterium SHHR-1]|uniref:mechanosensitive ion channel family protein n=1 Tax=Magnetovirga frankeli TaxID=947516 RepID=UPI001293D8EA|nr:mechanosensitive ion channel [gamma proteobacterium SS-5]